jgi:hypothetical protein
MNTLQEQLVKHNKHKMFNNINNVVNGLRSFMTAHGFKSKAVNRLFSRPQERKDVRGFLQHYPAVTLTQVEIEAFEQLVSLLNKLT